MLYYINIRKNCLTANSLNEDIMIKILHVLTDSNIGGAGTYVATCLEFCNKGMLEQTLVLPKNSLAKNLMQNSGAKIIEADIAPDKSLDFKSIAVIRKIIRSGDYDIVHAHGCASARIAARGLCKSVFTKHTLSSAGFGMKGLANKLLYRAMGGYAIAVSDAAFQNLVQLGFNKNKIFTVKNGVGDIGVPNADLHAKSKISFGIDPSKFVVGCVARFSPEKDYETFLFTAKKVCDNCDKIAFLLCGDGKTLDDMKSLAKKLGIYNKCVFAGSVYDPERAYRAMDLYFIASKHESFGLSLVESWSAGLPSVTSNTDGFSEISTNGETSLMFNVGDSTAFANAIIDLYNNPEKAKALADSGRKCFLQNYSADAFAYGITKVYRKIKNS